MRELKKSQYSAAAQHYAAPAKTTTSTEQRYAHTIHSWLEEHATRIINQAVPLRQVSRIGIIGAGEMGKIIAASNLAHGVAVSIFDINRKRIESAPEEIELDLATSYQTADFTTKLRKNLTITNSLRQLLSCDLILETISEDLHKKKDLLGQLSQDLPPDRIVASNTSTLSINELSKAVSLPERFCGLHFLQPLTERVLVEVTAAKQSAAATMTTALLYLKSIAKLPLMTQDSSAFVVNNLVSAYFFAACKLLDRGVLIDAIDRAAREFGMQQGPFELLDQIGLDTAWHCGRTFYQRSPGNVVIPPVLIKLIKTDQLGRKSGVGFYDYNQDSTNQKEPRLAATTVAALRDLNREPANYTTSEIVDFLISALHHEAERLLNDKQVSDKREIEAALIFGMGFPHSRGGLYFANKSS